MDSTGLCGSGVDRLYVVRDPHSAKMEQDSGRELRPIDELQKAEEAVAADMVARVGAGPVEVMAKTAEGPAALALAEAAREADLLVVGSRGLGGFTGLLLGSVSQQCAHHAPCPLVIVRSER